MKQHRRFSSLVHFSAEKPRPSPPARTSILSVHGLWSKADELQRPLAASKAGRTNPPERARCVGSEPPGRAAELLDEMRLRPGDDDLLLDMVHDLQQNMTRSISGSERGRLFERYSQRRDGKLREEQGSAEWARKKEVMKTMEDFLEETLALMMMKSPSGKNSFLQQPRNSAKKIRKQGCKEDLDVHAPLLYRSLHRTATDESGEGYVSGELSSSKATVYFSASQNSRALVRSPEDTCSGFTTQNLQPKHTSKQKAAGSSDLRKEKMKQVESVRNVVGHSDAKTFNRSRSTIASLDDFNEEKQPRFHHHMRTRSVALGELKELRQLKFDSSSLALSPYQKDQSESAASRKIQVRAGPKPFLRKGGGIGPGVGASISQLRVSKAHESWSKRGSDEDLVDQQAYSEHMIGNIDVEFERSKCRDFVFPAEVNNEALSCQGSGSSDDFKCVAEDYFHADLVSNNHSLSSANETSDTDTSVQSPGCNPSTSSTSHVNPMQSAHATRVRKKWGSVKKPNFATNDLDQPFKDVAKAFKKLLKFGSKSINAERKMNYPLSTSTSSGGGDDMEGGPGKQSLVQLAN